MRHFTSAKFWQCFNALPGDIQKVARRNYELLKQNPSHPSLNFKPVKNGGSAAFASAWAIARWVSQCRMVCSGFGSGVMRTTTNCLANPHAATLK